MNTAYQGTVLDDRCYASITAESFLSMIVPSDRCIVSLGSTDAGKGTCKELPLSEVPAFVQDKTNSYIYPASFFGKTPKTSLVDKISCFVVDIDDVADVALENLLDTIEKEECKPTHCVSTGNGYHLYYVFDEPIELRLRWKDKIQRVSDALYEHWTNYVGGCICDTACKSVPHGFRPVGSLSKDGNKVCQCWQISVDERIDIHVLDSWLGQVVEMKAPKDDEEHGIERGDFVPIGPSLIYKKTGERIDFNRIDPLENRNGQSSFVWDGRVFGSRFHDEENKKGLYEWTLKRAPNSNVGHRFLTMFCLAGIAYACGVSEQKLKTDLTDLVKNNWRYVDNPIHDREIDSAMRGYCPDYATLHRKTRESLLGWSYIDDDHPAPIRYPERPEEYKLSDDEEDDDMPFHRNRKKNCAYQNRRRGAKNEEEIEKYLFRHIDADKKEVAKALKLSWRTVHRHWDMAYAGAYAKYKVATVKVQKGKR